MSTMPYRGMFGLKAKRARREDTEYRRCIYCGRYMSYHDLNHKQAIIQTTMTWDYGSEDAVSHTEGWHVACLQKYKEQRTVDG